MRQNDNKKGEEIPPLQENQQKNWRLLLHSNRIEAFNAKKKKKKLP
jgi:hypothetical protein